MNIPNDLPLPAYYKLCDNIEKRINNLQHRGCGINAIDNKLIEIPVNKKTFDKCNQLRIELCEVKKLLELDNIEKITEDIKRLYEVVKERIN